jgi:hypothetical protein
MSWRSASLRGWTCVSGVAQTPLEWTPGVQRRTSSSTEPLQQFCCQQHPRAQTVHVPSAPAVNNPPPSPPPPAMAPPGLAPGVPPPSPPAYSNSTEPPNIISSLPYTISVLATAASTKVSLAPNPWQPASQQGWHHSPPLPEPSPAQPSG